MSPASAKLLELSGLKLQATRGLASLAARYGAVIAINLAGTAVLSRLLGPAMWGVFAIAQVLYLSSQEVLGRGVAAYLIKKEEAPSPADIRNTFALQHMLGLIFLVAAAALAHPAARWYGRGEITPLLFAAAIASYAYAWRSIPLALLERQFAYKKVALVEILEGVLFIGVAIALAARGHAVAGLGLAIVSRSVIPTLLVYALKPVRPSLFLHWNTLFHVADFGLFVAAGSLANIAVLSVPALVVGKLAGMEALGLARMGFALYASLLFATAAVLRLTFATYSRLAGHPGELAKSVSRHLQSVAIVLVPAVVLFAGLAPLWVPVLFGASWRALPTLLLALAPGYALAAVFWGVLSPALQVSGRHRQLALWMVGFTLSYALLTWALTPRWGALGSAAAFSVAEVLFYPLLFCMYARLHGMFEYRAVGRELAAGAVFVAAIWISAQHRPLAAPILAALYLALWYARNARSLLALRDTALAAV